MTNNKIIDILYASFIEDAKYTEEYSKVADMLCGDDWNKHCIFADAVNAEERIAFAAGFRMAMELFTGGASHE